VNFLWATLRASIAAAGQYIVEVFQSAITFSRCPPPPQATLRGSARVLDEEAAGRFGRAGDQLGPAADKIAERMNEADRNITRRFPDTFNRTPKVMAPEGLRVDFSGVVDAVKKPILKPKERLIPVGSVAGDEDEPAENRQQTLAPIVSSPARVGGGGFGVRTPLDAQRENNRLTGETNRLLGDLNRRVDRLGGSGQAAFD